MTRWASEAGHAVAAFVEKPGRFARGATAARRRPSLERGHPAGPGQGADRRARAACARHPRQLAGAPPQPSKPMAISCAWTALRSAAAAARASTTRCSKNATASPSFPSRARWSDVGSWNAVADLHDVDDNGNRISGQGFAMGAHQHLHPRAQPARRGPGHQGPAGGRHARRAAGRAQRLRRTGQGRGGAVDDAGPQPGDAASPHTAALGRLRQHRRRRAFRRQAPDGQARRPPRAANASPSRRTLGRRARARPGSCATTRRSWSRKTSRSTSPSAPVTGWKTPARPCSK